MTVPTGRDSDKFMLRLPDGMRDRLKETAAANNRSMNAEIIARLEASLTESVVADADMFQMLQESIALTKKQNEMIAALLERVPDASD